MHAGSPEKLALIPAKNAAEQEIDLLALSSYRLQPTKRHFCGFVVFALLFLDRVSLYIPGCSGTLYTDQSVLELRDLPTSASLSTGIKGLCHHSLLIPPTFRIHLSASNDQIKKSLSKERPEVCIIPDPI